MEILGTMPKRETIDMVAEEWQDRRNLRFKVRSREGVNSEWYREPFSVISIHDPQPEGFPNKIMPQEGLSKVLYLGFHDFDVLNGRSEDFWDRESMLNPGHTLRELAMTAEHAAQIWGFVSTVAEPLLVIHCEAGVSRSPSVAMAIADCLHIRRSNIDWHHMDVEQHPPNEHVYRTVRMAFLRWKRAA